MPVEDMRKVSMSPMQRGANMARNSKNDPEKVGVYDRTPEDGDRSPKKGGMPTWLIALLVIIVIVVLMVFVF